MGDGSEGGGGTWEPWSNTRSQGNYEKKYTRPSKVNFLIIFQKKYQYKFFVQYSEKIIINFIIQFCILSCEVDVKMSNF